MVGFKLPMWVLWGWQRAQKKKNRSSVRPLNSELGRHVQPEPVWGGCSIPPIIDILQGFKVLSKFWSTEWRTGLKERLCIHR
jgi:hypothetical protein